MHMVVLRILVENDYIGLLPIPMLFHQGLGHCAEFFLRVFLK